MPVHIGEHSVLLIAPTSQEWVLQWVPASCRVVVWSTLVPWRFPASFTRQSQSWENSQLVPHKGVALISLCCSAAQLFHSFSCSCSVSIYGWNGKVKRWQQYGKFKQKITKNPFTLLFKVPDLCGTPELDAVIQGEWVWEWDGQVELPPLSY